MQKLQDLLAYLTARERAASLDRMTRMVYLSDWKHVLENGRQITGIVWRWGWYGPEVPGGFTCGFEGGPGKPCLTESELTAANHVLKTAKGMSNAELIRLVNSTYPALKYERYKPLDLVEAAQEYKASPLCAYKSQPVQEDPPKPLSPRQVEQFYPYMIALMLTLLVYALIRGQALTNSGAIWWPVLVACGLATFLVSDWRGQIKSIEGGEVIQAMKQTKHYSGLLLYFIEARVMIVLPIVVAAVLDSRQDAEFIYVMVFALLTMLFTTWRLWRVVTAVTCGNHHSQ